MKRIAMLAVALGFVAAQVRAGDEKKADASIYVSTNVRDHDKNATDADGKALAARQKSIVGKTVLVSILDENGNVVRQSEMEIDAWRGTVREFRVPEGRYSVRFEGENLETSVKSGFLATAQNSPTVHADLLQGKGTRVVRYGEAGDPVKALEARVEKLEAALKELRKKRD